MKVTKQTFEMQWEANDGADFKLYSYKLDDKYTLTYNNKFFAELDGPVNNAIIEAITIIRGYEQDMKALFPKIGISI